ncbi:MAG: transposase [Candidatus Saccharibacteria bacterium]|nr:transposase [Moraxellaceae bacterium]
MSDYRRSHTTGGTYFFTLVAFKRRTILCDEPIRRALRTAIHEVRQSLPFEIDAWVMLPDHLHTIWTLPENDANFGKRWGLIKRSVSRSCPEYTIPFEELSLSNVKRNEAGIWQRRFWEHQIQNEDDFSKHMDYIHFNPVKHGYVKRAVDWPYSTFHRHMNSGVYMKDWGTNDDDDGEFGE